MEENKEVVSLRNSMVNASKEEFVAALQCFTVNNADTFQAAMDSLDPKDYCRIYLEIAKLAYKPEEVQKKTKDKPIEITEEMKMKTKNKLKM